MKIGNFDINEKVFIIAEIGANHEGNFDIARKMIEEASKTGVDAVKFQTYQAKYLVTKSERKRYEHFKKFELTHEQFIELSKLANARGLIFLSTPFDIDSVDFLNNLVPAFKIASGDLTCLPLIKYIATKGKPILLSTGLGNIEEIRNSIKLIEETNTYIHNESKIVLLHCVSNYPTRPEEVNLKAIPFMRDTFNLPVGYSDHTLGITTCLAAVALGAKVIEKHFTLNKYNQKFRDHQLSADINDMINLVKDIRTIEKSLGEYKKEPQLSELANIKSMRRSLAAKKDIPKGEIITEYMLTFLRPATGISPEHINEIIGKKVSRNIKEGAILFKEDIIGYKDKNEYK